MGSFHERRARRARRAEVAAAWLRSNYRGWARDGVMREKYDATRPGESGGGGEYEPQVGFGWTNGVALWLLRRYGASPSLFDDL